MATSPDLTERTVEELGLKTSGFEFDVLLGWLNPIRFKNADSVHEAVRKTNQEMGSLLYEIFIRIQDAAAREKRKKEVEEKLHLEWTQDRLDGTSYAQFRTGIEKRKDTEGLLTDATKIVREVGFATFSTDTSLSLAAYMALEGNPLATEAAIKGTPNEPLISKFTGVAHLMAAVVNIEDQLKGEGHSNPRGLVQIPLPESRLGRDHLNAGLFLVAREIDRTRVGQRN